MLNLSSKMLSIVQSLSELKSNPSQEFRSSLGSTAARSPGSVGNLGSSDTPQAYMNSLLNSNMWSHTNPKFQPNKSLSSSLSLSQFRSIQPGHPPLQVAQPTSFPQEKSKTISSAAASTSAFLQTRIYWST